VNVTVSRTTKRLERGAYREGDGGKTHGNSKELGPLILMQSTRGQSFEMAGTGIMEKNNRSASVKGRINAGATRSEKVLGILR